MSILRQCNMYPETTNIPAMPCISENGSRLDEESQHSSILDSTHIRNSPGILSTLHDLAVTKGTCNFFPSKLRGWKSRRRTNHQPATDDNRSPLLNPNAIHERQSLNMLDIEEDWTDDWSDNDDQENKIQKMNRGSPRTIPFKIYTRP